MRAIIKAVSKFKGLLVNDDKAWWNASKAAQATLPGDMAQFIGKEVELVVVSGENHKYSGFSLLAESGIVAENKDKPINTSVILSRDERISRMACLNSAISLVGITKKLEGRTIEEAKAIVLTLADELINWVNGK